MPASRQDVSTVLYVDADIVTKNVTKNGRLFCALLCLCNLAAVLAGYGPRFLALAVLAAAVPGLSVVVEQSPKPWRRQAIFATYALAAFVAVVTVYSASFVR